MDYALFIKSTKKSNRLVYTWVAFLGIGALIGIILLIVHETSGALWPLLLVALAIGAVIVRSIANVAISYAAKKLVRLIYAMERSEQPYRPT